MRRVLEVVLIWAVIGGLCAFAFDRAMDADARRLCDSDATADAGVCAQGYGQ